MKYTYVAVNNKNRKYHGEINAESRSEVIRLLQARGMTALTIDEFIEGVSDENAGKNIWEIELNEKDIHKVKVSKKKMLTMMHQMAIMMRAGITLSMTMDVLLESETDKYFRKILMEMNTELYNGIPLSQSMATFNAFPEIVVNIVQAGEANGRLDLAFEQCSRILQQEISLTSKIKGAMGYPIFLLILTVALIILMSTVVLPKFDSLFKSFGSDLPLLTKFTMGVSDFLIADWYIIILIIGSIIVGYKLLIKYNENFAMSVNKFILKVPFIGTLLRKSYISRFCRMISTLTDAGVSILRSLELARDVIANLYMKDCLNQIIEDVKIGTPINVSMSRYPVFDLLLVSMIRVGEESGALSESMMKMADMYEQQTDEATDRLTGAMTPAMTIIIGLIVGTVVISIVIPMFQMYDVIAAG